MKLNYRNFTRLGANSEGAKFVPKEHIRKPLNLRVCEMMQFFISVALFISMFYFAYTPTFFIMLSLGAVWLLASVLLAIDDYRYKNVTVAAGFASMASICVASSIVGCSWFAIVGLGVIGIFLSLFTLLPSNKVYFNWACSVGRKNI